MHFTLNKIGRTYDNWGDHKWVPHVRDFSYICYAQNMGRDNPSIILHNLWTHNLCKWIAHAIHGLYHVQNMDRHNPWIVLCKLWIPMYLRALCKVWTWTAMHAQRGSTLCTQLHRLNVLVCTKHGQASGMQWRVTILTCRLNTEVRSNQLVPICARCVTSHRCHVT